MRRKNLLKNKSISVFLALGVLVLILGVSYAYFGYYKRGTYALEFEGGKLDVLFTSVTGSNVLVEGMYPMSDEEGLENGITYEFNITGYNQSNKDIHYRIYMEDAAEIDGKTRFNDSDIKVAVYKDGEMVLKPSTIEDFYDPGVYFDVITKGTSIDTPVSGNYTIKLWIGEHVRITDTVCDSGYTCYSQDDYKNMYFSKILKVEADFSYDDLGYLTYNANGGEFTPEKTSVATQQVTAQKPVKEGEGFLGWSTNPLAIEPEYSPGDTYTGVGKTLYAVYSDTKNVMDVFSDTILEYAGMGEGGYDEPSIMNNDFDEYDTNRLTTNGADYSVYSGITKIYFINDTQENIDARYNAATIKDDLTLNNQGSVKAWLEDGENTYLKKEYTLYVGAEGTIYLSNCENMFEDFGFLYYLDLANVDTSMITSMYRMFANSGYYDAGGDEGVEMSNSIYRNYKIIPLSGYVTSPINLEIKNLDSLNTSNVTNMSEMFYQCNAFNLDVSKFNTSMVTDMSSMFYGIYDSSLNLNHFDTSNVENMAAMFSSWRISGLNIENFDTSNVVDMSGMFLDFSGITLDLQNFDTSNVENISHMFARSDIKNLDLSCFNTSKVTDMSYMFYYSSIENINFKNFETTQVTDMSYMFYKCYYLNVLDLSSFDTSNVTNMSCMFDGCSSLKKLNLSNFKSTSMLNESYNEGVYQLFGSCRNLMELDMSNFDMNNLNNFSSMFDDNMMDSIKIYVKSKVEVEKILLLTYYQRPSAWTIDNFVIKG